MAGPSADRAERICRDIASVGSQAVVLSRIPGASHCALEGLILAEEIRLRLGLPVVEIEVPPICDFVAESLRTRIGALVETVRGRQDGSAT